VADGEDPVRARFLYTESFEFQFVGKLWLMVNHKPIVRDDSHGFWRRVRLVPFTQTFSVDQTLGATLAREATGILTWAVRGCLAWRERGLEPPAVVLEATDDYRRAFDPIGDFLDHGCELDLEAEVFAGELFEHYQNWARNQAIPERERLSPSKSAVAVTADEPAAYST